MKAMQMKGSYLDGREDQFREMLQAFAALEGKYKGVRGELLAKVRDGADVERGAAARSVARGACARAVRTVVPGVRPRDESERDRRPFDLSERPHALTKVVLSSLPT